MTNIDFVIPGYSDFVNQKKPHVDPPITVRKLSPSQLSVYKRTHEWLDYHYGEEKKKCEDCGKEKVRLEWANISGKYLRDRKDYRILCRSCHFLSHSRLRTHCKYGHEFTPENTYTTPGKNHRRCRECNRLFNLRKRKNMDTVENHFNDNELDIDEDEYQLMLEDPIKWDYRVNGIKHIIVRDDNVEVRYVYKDGKLVNVKPGVF